MNSLGVWYLGIEKEILKLFLVSLYCLACDDPQRTSRSELLWEVLCNLSAKSSHINFWSQEKRETCRGDSVVA